MDSGAAGANPDEKYFHPGHLPEYLSGNLTRAALTIILPPRIGEGPVDQLVRAHA